MSSHLLTLDLKGFDENVQQPEEIPASPASSAGIKSPSMAPESLGKRKTKTNVQPRRTKKLTTLDEEVDDEEKESQAGSIVEDE